MASQGRTKNSKGPFEKMEMEHQSGPEGGRNDCLDDKEIIYGLNPKWQILRYSCESVKAAEGPAGSACPKQGNALIILIWKFDHDGDDVNGDWSLE